MLARATERHRPRLVALADREAAEAFRRRIAGRWHGDIVSGEEGVRQVAADSQAEIVVNAIVGAAGLAPSIAALEAGHRLALANKESLVLGGHLLRAALERGGGELLPVDSEHSAVFACLKGRVRADLERVVLTASGGPFRTLSAKDLARVRPGDALRHPTWRMGQRITVDSATLFNKGLEMIEACWLFDLQIDQVGVWVHPQSIVHAFTQWRDGSILAQLAPADMRLPIQTALSHPEGWGAAVKPCDLTAIGSLEFEAPDVGRFPCLRLAEEAFRGGGTLPAVANAADEVLVERFLAGEVGFLDIAAGIEAMLERHSPIPDPNLETILAVDRETRRETAVWQPDAKFSGRGQGLPSGGRS